MIKKITDKRHITLFVSLCWILYFTSYLTRLSYGASIAEIIDKTGISKTAAGFISTGGFISYGIGQIFSGILGDKYSPRYVILWGILSTSLANLLFPFISSQNLMVIVWVINGFAQAMLWPPLLKAMSYYLNKESFTKACVYISSSSSSGTIVIYLLVPLCISVLNWHLVFYFVSTLGIIVSFIWFFGMKYIESYTEKFGVEHSSQSTNNRIEENTSMPQLIIASGTIPIFFAIVLHGILKDGVTTWMPAYISEVYNKGNTFSILTTVILPIFSIICVNIASILNKKIFKNEVVSAAFMFGVGFIASVIMIPLFSSGVGISIFLAAVITGCMHGLNLMLISTLPSRFAKYGRVSSFSGLLNSFTYLGSAISTYAIAALAERFGWRFNVISWSIVAFLGTLMIILSIKRWNAFISNKKVDKLHNYHNQIT